MSKIENTKILAPNASPEVPLHRIREVRLGIGICIQKVLKLMKSANKDVDIDAREIRNQEMPTTDLRLTQLHEWTRALDVHGGDLLLGVGGIRENMQQLSKMLRDCIEIRRCSDEENIHVYTDRAIAYLQQIAPELLSKTKMIPTQPQVSRLKSNRELRPKNNELHRIEQTMKDEEMSVRTMARRLNISPSAVRLQTKPYSDMHLSTLYKYSAILGIPPKVLLSDSLEESQETNNRALLFNVARCFGSIAAESKCQRVTSIANIALARAYALMPELRAATFRIRWSEFGKRRSVNDPADMGMAASRIPSGASCNFEENTTSLFEVLNDGTSH